MLKYWDCGGLNKFARFFLIQTIIAARRYDNSSFVWVFFQRLKNGANFALSLNAAKNLKKVMVILIFREALSGILFSCAAFNFLVEQIIETLEQSLDRIGSSVRDFHDLTNWYRNILRYWKWNTNRLITLWFWKFLLFCGGLLLIQNWRIRHTMFWLKFSLKYNCWLESFEVLFFSYLFFEGKMRGRGLNLNLCQFIAWCMSKKKFQCVIRKQFELFP